MFQEHAYNPAGKVSIRAGDEDLGWSVNRGHTCGSFERREREEVDGNIVLIMASRVPARRLGNRYGWLVIERPPPKINSSMVQGTSNRRQRCYHTGVGRYEDHNMIDAGAGRALRGTPIGPDGG